MEMLVSCFLNCHGLCEVKKSMAITVNMSAEEQRQWRQKLSFAVFVFLQLSFDSADSKHLHVESKKLGP